MTHSEGVRLILHAPRSAALRVNCGGGGGDARVARLAEVVRLVLVVGRDVDEGANVAVDVDLLEERARGLVVADLRELVRDRVGPVPRLGEVVVRAFDDRDDLVAVLARGSTVGDDNDQDRLAQRAVLRRAKHERLEDLLLQARAKGRHAAELHLLDDCSSERSAAVAGEWRKGSLLRAAASVLLAASILLFIF